MRLGLGGAHRPIIGREELLRRLNELGPLIGRSGRLACATCSTSTKPIPELPPVDAEIGVQQVVSSDVRRHPEHVVKQHKVNETLGCRWRMGPVIVGYANAE